MGTRTPVTSRPRSRSREPRCRFSPGRGDPPRERKGALSLRGSQCPTGNAPVAEPRGRLFSLRVSLWGDSMAGPSETPVPAGPVPSEAEQNFSCENAVSVCAPVGGHFTFPPPAAARRVLRRSTCLSRSPASSGAPAWRGIAASGRPHVQLSEETSDGFPQRPPHSTSHATRSGFSSHSLANTHV